MAIAFRLSSGILGTLASRIDPTPVADDGSPFDYVDRGLAIVGQTLHVQNVEIEKEFLRQRQFTALEFRESEKRMGNMMDERFKQVDERFKQVDERFKQVDERFKQVDERFEQVDERFKQVASQIENLQTQLDNADAIRKNGLLRGLHQPIKLVKAPKPTPNPKEFVWAAPPMMPKHRAALYRLGQRAKGISGAGWEGMTKDERSEAQRQALQTISELTDFYNITVMSDDASDSDATEVMLGGHSVDEYMRLLLDEWGIDWDQVCKLGEQRMQPPPQQAGAKRRGDTSNDGARRVKHTRRSEGESESD